MLAKEKCVACRRDSPRVTPEDVAELHPQVPEWQITDLDGINRLQRTFPFRNFAGAMDFAGWVGAIAEDEGHHPRVTLEWGRVGVEWWTHKIKGLHHNDFVMSAKTDELYVSASDKPE